MAKLFSPLSIGPVELGNRIVISPMCQYSAPGGVAGDWHKMHLGQFAVANPGLIVIEGTAVEPAGRITPDDLCLYNDEQEEGLARLVEFLRGISGAKIAIQLFHSGRKGSQSRPWAENGNGIHGGRLSSTEGGWPGLAPSKIRFDDTYGTPNEADAGDLDRIRAAFASSAQRAARAGVDCLELHYAHGYLLHTFLSQVSNHRKDSYGGSLENRMRFPLEVWHDVRQVWPSEKALGARISGSDFGTDDGAWDINEAKIFASELRDQGCDFLDVSGGFLAPKQELSHYGPGFQVELAQQVKSEAGLPTFSVGVIAGPKQAEALLTDGQADAICLGRGALLDPRWPWRAARALGCEARFPPQYSRAFMHGFPEMFDHLCSQRGG